MCTPLLECPIKGTSQEITLDIAAWIAYAITGQYSAAYWANYLGQGGRVEGNDLIIRVA